MTLGLRDLGYTSRGDWFTRSSGLLSQLGFEAITVTTGEENLIRDARMDTDSPSYLSLPGESGDYASTPDSAALDITGDIDLRAAAALDDWTPSVAAEIQDLIDKFPNSPDSGYLFRINDDPGNLKIFWHDGSLQSEESTEVPSVSDGELLLVRVTLDVDNGSSGYDVKFYTKESTPRDAASDLVDNSGWTQLGDTVTGGSTTSITTNSQALAIGRRNDDSGYVDGKYYAAAVLDGIDGAVAFHADFTDHASGTLTFTEDSPNAATVTVNQSGDPVAEIVRPTAPGLVDGFSKVDDAAATFSVDPAVGAQKISVDGSQAGTVQPRVLHYIVDVTPGEEVTILVEGKVANATGAAAGRIAHAWKDNLDGFLGGAGEILFTDTAFSWHSQTVVVPVDAAYLEFSLQAQAAAGEIIDVWFRNARYVRAGAAPAAYAAPRVLGAGQIGETLVTAGWPASRRNLLAAGDSFRAGGSGPTRADADALTPLLVAAETVSSDANGEATIALDAAIGVGNDPADGAALRLGEG